MTAIAIIAGIVALLALVIVVQSVKKSNYTKAVHRELEKLPDSAAVLQARTSPDDELKTQVAMLQIRTLKECYRRGLPPENAAAALAGATDEWVRQYSQGDPQ